MQHNKITSVLCNDNNTIKCRNKKRKMNEDTINYKELYEVEQMKVKALKGEMIMIRYECLRLISEHTQMQSSIMILRVLFYYFITIINTNIIMFYRMVSKH